MADVLVLGGSGWLSGEVAAQAVVAGHRVTCAARGRSPFPEGVRPVLLDRDDPDGLAPLRDQRFDVVVDVSRQPGQVRRAVVELKAGHVVLVSTGSVYAAAPQADETDPLLPAAETDTVGVEQYGEGKVACEQAVLALDDRGTTLRAGLIGGPGDGSDRFGYWPAAAARARERPLLVPRVPDAVTQLIDVRDAAAFALHTGLTRTAGAFDLTGEPTPFDEVVALSRRAAGHTGDVVAVEPDALVAAGVAYWAGPRSLPLWLPPDIPLATPRSSAAALAAGLVRRPLAETVADVLADERVRGLDRPRSAGLTRDEEDELIARLAP